MAEAKETSHLTTIKKQWALKKQAAERPHFKAVNGELVPYTVSRPKELAAVVDATIAAEKEALKKAEAEVLANAQIGQMIAGHGVFIGVWTPKDRAGNSLGKTFNVFAAPQDLTNTSGQKVVLRYVDAVKRIAGLRGWNGFDGTHYATDKELYKALKDGSYNGGWIIPTRELLVGTNLLTGTDPGGNQTQPDNLYTHKEKGVLKSTFTIATSKSACPDWYWSSTEHRNEPTFVCVVRFLDGDAVWYLKNDVGSSCRPVRLEPRL